MSLDLVPAKFKIIIIINHSGGTRSKDMGINQQLLRIKTQNYSDGIQV